MLENYTIIYICTSFEICKYKITFSQKLPKVFESKSYWQRAQRNSLFNLCKAYIAQEDYIRPSTHSGNMRSARERVCAMSRQNWFRKWGAHLKEFGKGRNYAGKYAEYAEELWISRIRGRLRAANRNTCGEIETGRRSTVYGVSQWAVSAPSEDAGPRCDCKRWETREIRFNVLIVPASPSSILPREHRGRIGKGFIAGFNARRRASA